MRMQILAMVGVVAGQATAHADRPPAELPAYHLFGLGFEVQDLDAGGGRAEGNAAVASAAVGVGRWAAFVELGAGTLDAVAADSSPRIGSFVDSRLGGRIQAVTLAGSGLAGVDLDLDVGIGRMHDWLDQAASLDRTYGFIGWTTQVRYGDHHGGGAFVALRMSGARTAEDPAALRVICRGTCPTSSSALPLDVGLMFSLGALGW